MADLYNPRVEALKGHAAMLLLATLTSGSFTLRPLTAPHLDPAPLTALRLPPAAAPRTASAETRLIISSDVIACEAIPLP